MNYFLNRHRLSQALILIALTAMLLLAAACTGLPSELAPAVATKAATEEAPEEAGEAAPDAAATAGPAEESVDIAAMASGELTVADEEFKGWTVGFTAEGYPFRGSPDAPVVMFEYSDFQCPFCARHAVQTTPAIDDNYVREGIVRVVFRDFPLVDLHPNAPTAHQAALCAADQGAVAYWELHEEIFRTQDEWSNSADPAAFFAELAGELELDAAAIEACIASGEKQAIVDAGVADARTHGFTGTPSFLMANPEMGGGAQLVGAQGFDVFANYIDSVALGEDPVDAQAQAAQDAYPQWATVEGITPDPDRPNYNMAGDQFKGNPDADIIVVEFSDFQCPFCRRHTQDTQPVLDEQFVDTGDVLWIYKHFPLTIHPQAPAAGAAAECAGEQELFWEMHELIFENTEAWSNNDPNAALTEIASELDLDMDTFAACLEDPAIMERVTSDFSDGQITIADEQGNPQFLVSGTPTFVFLYREQEEGPLALLTRPINGALPEESFTQLLSQIVADLGEGSE
jgi:protein-disulfide isomerase